MGTAFNGFDKSEDQEEKKRLEHERLLKQHLKKNEGGFIMPNLQNYFIKLLSEKKKTINDVAKRGSVGASNLAKIYEGVRLAPKRDTVIKIGFGLELSIQECQDFLQYCEVGLLNPKIRRDSIIMFCLDINVNAKECDRMLSGENERGII